MYENIEYQWQCATTYSGFEPTNCHKHKTCNTLVKDEGEWLRSHSEVRTTDFMVKV